ncbi:sigma-54-dependent Fis family transcriptional regulator [Arabiibacter massiliensis]|uniref:sigma-54-dependent Fis family transcriptional regulator n=1 Tax=Arabiibacter massiliensis TaxID=1870985 RepID=UPI00155B37BC|nr:sigma 54-interacting transcriptional regulator [Arabiibacter massiliensis]
MDDFVIESLENIKQTWLHEHQETLDSLPETIADSWRRSLAFGVDPSSARLPPIADWIDGYAAGGQDPLAERGAADFARSLDELCAESRIAFAFANRSLRVVRMIGHPNVLKRLAERNIDRGASLSERSAGTNALSLSPFLNVRTFLKPGEHFSKAFEGFATAANAPSPRSSVRTMALVPDKLDAEALLPLVKLVLDACDVAFEARQTGAAGLIGNAFFGELLEEHRTSCMVADAEGRVVSLSEGFASAVGGRCALEKGADASGFVRALEPMPAARRDRAGRERMIGMLRTGSREYVARRYEAASAAGETVYTLQEAPRVGVPAHMASASPASLRGTGKRVAELRQTVERAARTGASVLVCGEPGTEKALIARIIHNLSAPDGPFVHLDCASVEHEGLARAIFGSEAQGCEEPGALERARGGTLYLSSIERIPSSVQARLADALTNSMFAHAEGFEQHPLEARLIASSHADLSQLARQELFRADLLYLLDVVRIESIPLRERSDDFEDVLAPLLEDAAEQTGRKALSFTEEALRALREYPWPGNLHELRNVLAKLHFDVRGESVTPRDLPAGIVACAPPETRRTPTRRPSNQNARSQEEATLRSVLDKIGDNKTECARVLGISRQTLYNRMRKYGIVDE